VASGDLTPESAWPPKAQRPPCVCDSCCVIQSWTSKVLPASEPCCRRPSLGGPPMETICFKDW